MALYKYAYYYYYYYTCQLETGFAANGTGARLRVGGVAVVDAEVRQVPGTVLDAQEEQLTAGQQHAVRCGIIVGRHHRLPVAVPRDDGCWVASRLAVQSCRLVADHVLVFRVLHDARVGHIIRRRTACTCTEDRLGRNGKEKESGTCIAPIVSISTTKRSDVDHTELAANTAHLPFLRISIR